MKLWHSPASPFVRKCMVVAHELALAEKIELLDAAAHPINRDQRIGESNPFAKVPTMILDDGHVLFDSAVICAYLDEQHNSKPLFPKPTSDDKQLGFNALVTQSIGDGMMEAAVLMRYERAVRPVEKQWDEWVNGQFVKLESALDYLEMWRAARLQDVHIGSIAVACALGYLDFRLPEFDWRSGRPVVTQMYETFSKRSSMKATEPVG